jgi:hypothetical protein
MNIIETDIPDVNKKNVDKHKEIIADNIIQNVYPLFDEVYNAKVHQAVDLKNKIKTRRNELHAEKDKMQALMLTYKREQKISQILDRIDKLVKSGLAHDGSMKRETVILLKILDKLPDDKLDQQLAKTVQILNKRFSQ